MYFVGEALSSMDDGSLTMSHIQHLIMSGWFTTTGIIQMVHMFGFVQGNGFAIVRTSFFLSSFLPQPLLSQTPANAHQRILHQPRQR